MIRILSLLWPSSVLVAGELRFLKASSQNKTKKHSVPSLLAVTDNGLVWQSLSSSFFLCNLYMCSRSFVQLESH